MNRSRSCGLPAKAASLTVFFNPNFVPNQHYFTTTFGMAFSVDTTTQQEALYVAGTGTPSQLGTLDVGNYQLSPLGFTNPTIVGSNVSLTSTGSGQLFALTQQTWSQAGAELVQIDKATAQVTNAVMFPDIDLG